MVSSDRWLDARSLWRTIATANPFYLLSAVAVLYGLLLAALADPELAGGWTLAGLIGAYMLLLTATALVIVRVGQVWDDARSILFVLVLVDLALAVSIDPLTVDTLGGGCLFAGMGLLFSVVVVESLLCGLRMRLSLGFRLPLYAILGLQFGYSVGLGYCAARESYEWLDRMRHGVVLFPVVAGAVLLLLLPAARRPWLRGVSNGTPWSWPWYPWSLFLVWTGGLVLRSGSLCYGFDVASGTEIGWRPYLAIPILGAALAVFVELTRQTDRWWLRHVALWLPFSLVGLAFPGGDNHAVAQRLVTVVQYSGLAPVQWTLLGLLLFYAFFRLRGARSAEIGIVLCLLLLSIVDVHTLGVRELARPQTWSLDVLAIGMLAVGMLSRTSYRVWLGTLVGFISLSLRDRPEVVLPQPGYYAVHATVLMVLILAAWFDDAISRIFRRLSRYLLPVAAVLAVVAYPLVFPQIPAEVHQFYITGLTAVALVYWLRCLDVVHLETAILCGGALAMGTLRGVYHWLERSRLEHGLVWLAIGIVVLLLATLISFAKGGIVRRVRIALYVFTRRLRRPI